MNKRLSIIPIIAMFCLLLIGGSINNVFAASSSDASTNAEAAIEGKININNADEEQLVTLPGVGPKMATRIQDYRKENGPFKTVDDLLNVKGIGPKVLEKLKPYIEVS